MKRAKCGGCGAWIIWAKTDGGKNIPIDVKEYPDGNMALEVGPDGRIVARVRRSEGWNLRTYNRKSHFATCPEAGRFRR